MMKNYILRALALLPFLGMTSCEPLEDNSWTCNSVIRADWSQGNLETGRRPVDIPSMQLMIYPHLDNETGRIMDFPKDYAEVNLAEGIYDFLLLHDSALFRRTEMYRTAEVNLPVKDSPNKEHYIVANPGHMLYAGLLENDSVDDDRRTVHRLEVIRLMKRINFIVDVSDDAELVENIQMDLAGIANRMTVWNQKLNFDYEAVILFELEKRGRHLNWNGRRLTTFVGSAYVLGMTGRNVLYLTFTDAAGREHTLPLDLTSCFKHWSTEEVTLRMMLGVKPDGDVSISPVDMKPGGIPDNFYDSSFLDPTIRSWMDQEEISLNSK